MQFKIPEKSCSKSPTIRLRCPIFIGDFEFLHFIRKLQTTCGKRDIYIKVKIYSFIQTTRYFILTIEAVRSEERVFETESTIFLLKFHPISCFFFFLFSRVITGSNWIYLPAYYMFIFKRSQNNNFTSEAWLCSPKSGCYVYSVLASD